MRLALFGDDDGGMLFVASRRRLCRRLGRLSYELYLSHMFVVLGTVQLYRALLGDAQAWTFVVYAPVVAGSFGLALVLERLMRAIERTLKS